MYVFVEADNLDLKGRKVGQELNATFRGTEDTDNLPIRRPYRGIQIKDDTYAILSIWSGSKLLPILRSESAFTNDDEGKGSVSHYADFVLQGVDEQRQEKMQVIETFGDPYIYFYGEKPRFVTFRGMLVNTEDFNWRSQFWYNYDRFLRGTKLVEMNARAFLSYDSIVVGGYPISAQASEDSESPYMVPFSVTMLVTNYYDYSDVGQTRFPGFGAVDTNAINEELTKIVDRREGYISTTAEVRSKNLTAGGGGILSEIRKGIRAINDITSVVSNFVDSVQDVVGGRTVRLPIGIAGYLQTTGAATVASGSISNWRSQSLYDAATGTYQNVSGSVKLKMPGAAWFTKIPGGGLTFGEGENVYVKGRGHKSDNVDEYPLRKADTVLKDLLSSPAYIDYTARTALRQLAADIQDIQINAWNFKAEAGGLLSDIADGVNMLKNGFGMAMTAVAFAKDPMGVLRSSLGLGADYLDPRNWDIGGRFERFFGQGEQQNTQLFPDGRETHPSEWTKNPTIIKQRMSELGMDGLPLPAKLEVRKRLGDNVFDLRSAELIRQKLAQERIKELAEAAGATNKSNTSFSERQAYIGAKAKERNQTFESTLEDERLQIDLFGSPDTPVELGVAYESGGYLPQSTDLAVRETFAESAEYEEAYGDNDYTSLAQLPSAAGDVDIVTKTIKEAYDDGSIVRPSEITESAIQEVYGTGYESTQIRSAEEIAELLAKLFEGYEQTNEEQEGIRGIYDEGAEIEPVR